MYIFNDAQCANGILIIQFEDDVHSYESHLKWQFGMKKKMWTGNEAKQSRKKIKSILNFEIQKGTKNRYEETQQIALD